MTSRRRIGSQRVAVEGLDAGARRDARQQRFPPAAESGEIVEADGARHQDEIAVEHAAVQPKAGERAVAGERRVRAVVVAVVIGVHDARGDLRADDRGALGVRLATVDAEREEHVHACRRHACRIEGGEQRRHERANPGRARAVRDDDGDAVARPHACRERRRADRHR